MSGNFTDLTVSSFQRASISCTKHESRALCLHSFIGALLSFTLVSPNHFSHSHTYLLMQTKCSILTNHGLVSSFYTCLCVMCVSKVLEQDKYSLQKEVELKTRMLQSLQSDYDCVKNQQRQQLEEQREHLERSHSTALNELNNKVQPHIVWSKQTNKQTKPS